MKMNFKGLVSLHTLPKTTPLLPLYEAVINSIQSIEDAHITNGKIEIVIEREKQMNFFEQWETDVENIVIIDNGIEFNDDNYAVYPGEWICTVKELTAWFRTRFQRQAVSILNELQKRHLSSYLLLDRGKVVKYKIRDWKKHNTVLDYNCPCQKDTGFFFMTPVVATKLVSVGRCSEMDILLDLWMSAVYNDGQVQGSEIAPVVYFRTGTGSLLAAYSGMAVHWGISKVTIGHVLKKLADMDYISLMSFSGRTGSVIYLHSYLFVMFQISDALVDKELSQK